MGAGGGAVTWDGQALTISKVISIVAQGPAGHSMNLFGYFKDPSGDPIDHYLWLWTEKSNGQKYLWVLTDRVITGDSDPKKYGTVQVLWAAKYNRAPVAGDSWPSLTTISENAQKDISAYMQAFESAYLSGGSGGLVAQAKANCADSYGTTVCNAKTWKRSDRRTLIFHNTSEYETFVASYDGDAFLHDPSDPGDTATFASIGSWILVWLTGCGSTCPEIPQSECEAKCLNERNYPGATACAYGRNPGNFGGPCDALQCWNGGCANVMAPETYISSW